MNHYNKFKKPSSINYDQQQQDLRKYN